MPTPIGHMLAGAIIFKSQKKSVGLFLFLSVLLFALLPDIDFLFGLIVGDANRYHHLWTHSLAFTIVAGFLGGFFFAKWRCESLLFSSAIFISAGTSHVFLDCLALDKREPFGCPIWWPFSQKFIISPVPLFSDVSRVSDSHLFFESLLNMHNLRTVLIEIALLVPILIFVWKINRTIKPRAR